MNLGQVYTRRSIADFMTAMFSLENGSRVLDPCFGRGVFVESLLRNTTYKIMGVEIDPISFNVFTNPDPARCELRNCDFFDVTEEFDGIIMNPPYVRQEEIDQLAPVGVTKRKLQSACGLLPISSKANLYMYFILRAILQLRQGGELIAIFPNSWTNTALGKEFRNNIMRLGYIARFINVEGNPFEGVPLVDVCIMEFIRGLSGETEFQRLKIDGGSLELSEDERLREGQAKGLVSLKSVATVRRGITTGYNKLFVNPPIYSKGHLVDILSSPKGVKGYSTKNCRLDKLLLLTRDTELTEDERAYIEACARLIEKEGKPKTLLAMIRNKQKWYVLSLPQKAQIVFSYIVRNNLKFILNDGHCNVRDNFYLISSRFKPELLMALLNNYHVFCQLENSGKSYGKGLLKLQTYDVNDIRIPNQSLISKEDMEELQKAGKGLAENGGEANLDIATKVLDNYYGRNDSKSRFLAMKEKRLEQI